MAAARGSKMPFAKRLAFEDGAAADFVKSRSRNGELVVTFKGKVRAGYTHFFSFSVNLFSHTTH